jgi:hypothetical protein
VLHEVVVETLRFVEQGVVDVDDLEEDLAALVLQLQREQNWWYAMWDQLNVGLVSLFMWLDMRLGTSAEFAPAPSLPELAIIIVWAQIMGIAVYTIWARGVGPRFRPDQMSGLT